MNISVELTLATKLKAAGSKVHVFDGLTTHEQRREKIRVALKEIPADKQAELSKLFLLAYRENP